MRTLRVAAALAAATLLAAACDGDDEAGRARPRPSPQSTPAPTAPPGNLDVARSEEATASVRACARDQNVQLRELKVRVDSEGVLIGVGYRATGDAVDAEDVVQQCIADAGITLPAQ